MGDIVYAGNNDVNFTVVEGVGVSIVGGLNSASLGSGGALLIVNNLSDVADAVVSLNNLLPDQAGNENKVLMTDGTAPSWQFPIPAWI